MSPSSAKLFFNKRKEPRHPHAGSVSIVYKKHLYPGKIKNYSPSGLFIKADILFAKGEHITVTLPDSLYKNHQRKGRIVWKNGEGCGVQFYS